MEKFKHINNIAWNSFAEQVFIVSFSEKKQIHELNSEASYLWCLLAEPKSSDELSVHLQSEYDVTASMAKSHVEEYLKELQSKGLICLAQ